MSQIWAWTWPLSGRGLKQNHQPSGSDLPISPLDSAAPRIQGTPGCDAITDRQSIRDWDARAPKSLLISVTAPAAGPSCLGCSIPGEEQQVGGYRVGQ